MQGKVIKMHMIFSLWKPPSQINKANFTYLQPKEIFSGLARDRMHCANHMQFGNK